MWVTKVVEAKMTEELKRKILSCASLPSVPAVAMQVLEMAQKAEVDLPKIAQLISTDPALAGKILKTVNSSSYGRSQPVSMVSHAIVIMGLQAVKTLALGFSLVTNLRTNNTKGFDHVSYWRRSIYAATAASLICEKVRIVQKEEAFLAALLKDIGMLVLDRVLGAEYGEVWKDVKAHSELPAAETAALGATHAEVGAMIAEFWKLPAMYIAPIAFHHDPDNAGPESKTLAKLVWLSARCAEIYVEENPAEAILCARQGLMELVGCDGVAADALISEIGIATRESANLFEIKLDNSVNFNDILARANDALVGLSLEMQAQTSNLQEQNQQLKVQATTDRLTQLNNRASFDESMSEAFLNSTKNGNPLSLIMLDVDKFKRINDTYGHPAGDSVLRALAQLVRKTGRPGDTCARFGGEEMVIVLPNTSRATATAIAEALRKAAQTLAVRHEVHSITFTISLGVATFEKGVPFTQPAHLLKAADLAVYKAKHSGRNNVKVFTLPPVPAPVPGRAAA